MALPRLSLPLSDLVRPAATPIWNEGRVAIETANLLRSRVWAGEGVYRGADRPVIMVPGFLAGDGSFGPMTRWLRRMGYRTSRAGMRSNIGCSGKAVTKLETRVEELAERHRCRVAIIGQSRGGTMARALAVSRPDLVSGIVCLGSPLDDLLAVNPLVLAQVGIVGALGTARIPGLFSARCFMGDCCEEFRAAMEAPFPEDVGFVSVYSRRDGIVAWKSCLDEHAELVEVHSSHCGMSVDAATYRAIANALHAFSSATRAPAPVEESTLFEAAAVAA